MGYEGGNGLGSPGFSFLEKKLDENGPQDIKESQDETLGFPLGATAFSVVPYCDMGQCRSFSCSLK
jgi:hypothetical protein